MAQRFAADTHVPVEKTRGEIEALMRKQGASGFGYSWDEKGDRLMFEWNKCRYQFRLPTVDAHSERVRAQRDRQRWRALLLVIRAKLEAVALGISIFEEEFLAFVITREGTTVGEQLVPRLRDGKGLGLSLQLPPGK